MNTVLKHKDALVYVEEIKPDRYKINIEVPDKKSYVPIRRCETAYPLPLIEKILNIKGLYLCDEILRDESPAYVQLDLKYDILSYLNKDDFQYKRILDFGCGAGASTVVLARMLPESEIIGIDASRRLLAIGEERCQLYSMKNVKFLPVTVDELAKESLLFDFIVLSAVYEHLLPDERRVILVQLWNMLKPGGVLFVNQTPHRYFPIEIHTTGLPMINYLPDRAALFFAATMSKRNLQKFSWQELLRMGIRGGTEREILKILKENQATPVLLSPINFGIKSGISIWDKKTGSDKFNLWYDASRNARYAVAKKIFLGALKLIKLFSGITLTPSLSLAIKKGM